MTRRVISMVVILLFAAACADAGPASTATGSAVRSGSDVVPETPAPGSTPACRDASGWALRYGWDDPAVAIRVGISPTRDHGDVYAVRVGSALWLTDTAPIGEGGSFVAPANEVARELAAGVGISVAAADSPWADLVSLARAATDTCDR